MLTTTTPTRLPKAPRNDPGPVPASVTDSRAISITSADWTTRPSPWIPPDCTCPVDCARDHENE